MTAAARRLTTGDKARLVAPVVIYAILAVVAWKLGWFHEQKVAAMARASTRSLYVDSAFVLIYAAGCALALPVTPLAYGAGAVFGFWRASILVWTASMLGAIAGYYLARGILEKPARALLGRSNEMLRSLRKGNVFLTSLRFQLMPVKPFGVFNYAAAISKLDPVPFFAGTAIGIIPGTLMATFIGDRVAAGAHGKSRKPFLVGGAVALLAITLSFAPKLWKKLSDRKSR
ncbi:MAG TPA: VTT domain-containing protein [Gemmatimonadaceae bacterium]|nr:VTT domain-containing protein [Gemmatimonadaceae bacterium]